MNKNKNEKNVMIVKNSPLSSPQKSSINLLFGVSSVIEKIYTKKERKSKFFLLLHF